jgi:hypothetical protein
MPCGWSGRCSHAYASARASRAIAGAPASARRGISLSNASVAACWAALMSCSEGASLGLLSGIFRFPSRLVLDRTLAQDTLVVRGAFRPVVGCLFWGHR